MSVLKRSKNALRATSVFYQGFNDVDVYIEDTAVGYKKLFLVLLQRLLEGTVAISQIFPLGGRVEVVAEACKFKARGGRPSIFIVDGDLFLLAGERYHIPDNLIVLPRYCIENIIFDKNAIVDFLDDEDCNLRHDELDNLLEFDRWKQEMEDCFRELFILFAIAHHLGLGIKSVSIGYQEFITKDGLQNVDKSRVDLFVAQYISDIVGKVGEVKYLQTRSLIEKNIVEDKCFVSTYVSAKDFLLPLLIFRMRKIVKIRSDNLNIKMRLAKRCAIDDLKSIKDRIGQGVVGAQSI